MGSRGSIYDPAGDSSDCSEHGEIMGGNGMKRAVLTAQTRQENIQDESKVHHSPLSSKPRKGIKYSNYTLKCVKYTLIVGILLFMTVPRLIPGTFPFLNGCIYDILHEMHAP